MILRLIGAACAGLSVQLTPWHPYWAVFFLVVALNLFADADR